MITLQNKIISFSFSECQQCGTCQAVCPSNSISFKLRKDGLSDVLVNHNSCIGCKMCLRACPAATVDDLSEYNNDLKDREFFFAYNSDKKIRHSASSGGGARTLIIEALKSGRVDGVYTLRKSKEYPFAEGHLYTKDDLPSDDKIPNSIYHSVMLGQNIKEIKKCDRLMIVGTTCQLKAIKVALKGKYKELILIDIFCKQQKNINATRFMAKAMGAEFSMNNFTFQYRGTGWPGVVKINNKNLPWHRAAQLPFGRRLWSVPGCNVCGDPFGLAVGTDLSLMDPWVIREQNDLGETLVTVNSDVGLELLTNTNRLVVEPQNYEDILPALGLEDIRRKQQLIPYFRGEKCSPKVKKAGDMEQLQRRYLQAIAMGLPKMPVVFYRLMCKLPDLRNLILK
ncbi:MAG: Coenzyme F420 hydrogenase/dehydrogenase, beta subunit C-terminal domain [Rikenellaceae bacterium]